MERQQKELEDASHYSQCLESESDEEETAALPDRQQPRVIDSRIRKIIYKSLEQNVPVYATKPLLDYTFQCLNVHTSRVPSASTISRCAYEVGALADLQAAEFMLKANSLTILWDATTLKGDHLDAIQVSSDTDILAITTDKLPGGRSDDYAEHIVDAIRHLVDVYCAHHGKDPVVLFREVISKWKCTLSDRASVNHCTVQKLQDQFDIELIELNCNLHPLECVASTARDALLKHEREMKPGASEPSLFDRAGKRSECLGASAGVVNLISAISKLRYKDGKGDPLGFKTFLAENNIDNRLLVRYVGNRLHTLFHLGGSIFHLRDSLLAFMEVCSQEKIRQAVKADLRDDVILLHLQVLGLLGKTVTAPWMTELYTDSKTRQHLQLAWSLSGVLDFLKTCEASPELLLETTRNAFGKQLLQTAVLDSLRQPPKDLQMYNQVVQLVVSQIHLKVSKQLQPYISGRLAPPPCNRSLLCSSSSNSEPSPGGPSTGTLEPSPDDPSTRVPTLVELTSSAPAHNMYAERALGMMDSLLRRAPSASIKTIDARVRARLNGTTDWLERHVDQESLIVFARKQGMSARKRNSVVEKRLNERVAERQKEKGQQREMKNRRKVEKSVLDKLKSGTIEDLLEDLDTDRQKFINDLLCGRIGVNFRHVWATETGLDDIWMGSIRKVRKDKKLAIFYWKDEDSAASGVQYQIKLDSLITDAWLGDIIPSA